MNDPTPRPIIAVRDVVRRFGNVTALDGVSVDIRAGEFFSLLGPSGCGKTTLLRLLAGFDEPDAGTIHIDGKPMAGVPANLRPTNMVFQSYAIFPHLNVVQNVGYGLRRLRHRDQLGERHLAFDLRELHTDHQRTRHGPTLRTPPGARPIPKQYGRQP